MKALLFCVSLLLFSATTFSQEGAPDTQITPVDPRTNTEGYPSSRPVEASSPSLKQLAGAETKLWQARTSGKTSLIKKLMSEDVTIASYTSAKDRQQWIAAIETGTCQWKSYKLNDFVLKVTSPTAASISYRAEQDAVCSGRPLPRTVNVVSTYLNREGAWRNIYYEER